MLKSAPRKPLRLKLSRLSAWFLRRGADLHYLPKKSLLSSFQKRKLAFEVKTQKRLKRPGKGQKYGRTDEANVVH